MMNITTEYGYIILTLLGICVLGIVITLCTLAALLEDYKNNNIKTQCKIAVSFITLLLWTTCLIGCVYSLINIYVCSVITVIIILSICIFFYYEIKKLKRTNEDLLIDRRREKYIWNDRTQKFEKK